jgi:hypothetical protein
MFGFRGCPQLVAALFRHVLKTSGRAAENQAVLRLVFNRAICVGMRKRADFQYQVLFGDADKIANYFGRSRPIQVLDWTDDAQIYWDVDTDELQVAEDKRCGVTDLDNRASNIREVV